MPCDETKLNQTSESLSPAQHAVLEAMLAGRTITAAAVAAGVGRAAVYRWLKNDFLFQAELNRGLSELRRAIFVNVHRLTAKAVQCVEKAIDEGNVKVALEVMRRAGLFNLPPTGSDDPAKLAAEAAELQAENDFHDHGADETGAETKKEAGKEMHEGEKAAAATEGCFVNAAPPRDITKAVVNPPPRWQQPHPAGRPLGAQGGKVVQPIPKAK